MQSNTSFAESICASLFIWNSNEYVSNIVGIYYDIKLQDQITQIRHDMQDILNLCYHQNKC